MKIRYFAATLLIVATFAGGAVADCGPFPENAYLGKLTHHQVSDYVTRAHGGDWAPYIAMFDKKLTALKAINQRGSGVSVMRKGKKVTLSGSRLTRYIQVLEQRLEVSRCLSKTNDDTMMAALKNFSTAAGSDTSSSETLTTKAQRAPIRLPAATWAAGAQSTQQAEQVQEPEPKAAPIVAAATQILKPVLVELENRGTSATPLGVEISASCVDGDTVFRLANTGDSWPEQGKFALYRLDGDKRQMVSARRMRLTQGQKASFRVKARHNPTGQIGLFVEPLWYERPFILDAQVTCR